ncbi:unnamed protein product [Amoebophrya sp. A25]|nr:unnamed protein product [Amoebophrya sp. A25]|eukprot:GSA25T00020556001.1
MQQHPHLVPGPHQGVPGQYPTSHMNMQYGAGPMPHQQMDPQQYYPGGGAGHYQPGLPQSGMPQLHSYGACGSDPQAGPQFMPNQAQPHLRCEIDGCQGCAFVHCGECSIGAKQYLDYHCGKKMCQMHGSLKHVNKSADSCCSDTKVRVSYNVYLCPECHAKTNRWQACQTGTAIVLLIVLVCFCVLGFSRR